MTVSHAIPVLSTAGSHHRNDDLRMNIRYSLRKLFEWMAVLHGFRILTRKVKSKETDTSNHISRLKLSSGQRGRSGLLTVTL